MTEPTCDPTCDPTCEPTCAGCRERSEWLLRLLMVQSGTKRDRMLRYQHVWPLLPYFITRGEKEPW